MSNVIKLKRADTPNKTPLTTDLDLGELAVNTNDGKLFLKKKVGTVESVVALKSSELTDYWSFLATQWSSPPTFLQTISTKGGGDVYSYAQGGTTRYRLVPTTYSADNDAFYATFTSGTLSDFIVSRSGGSEPT